MAVALRSNSDLVYLPDHGFVGEDGALRILINVNRQIRRIDVSHNLLGPDGLAVLVQGLTTLRSRFSSADSLWGIKEINLASNELTDAAMQAVLNYAKKDVCMERLLLQGNNIQMSEGIEAMIHTLNSSNLTTLSLNQNTLNHKSLIHLFETLDSHRLSELHLSTCGLTPELAEPIAKFLGSSRCRNLDSLELNGNQLGAQGVKKIVDVIESSNFTVKQLGVLANDVGGTSINSSTGIGDDGLGEGGSEGGVNASSSRDTRSDEAKRRDASMLEYQIHHRLPDLLERNRTLTRRIRRATMKCIVPARVILTARPPSDTETARQVIHDISNGSTIRPFPLLEFPPEVVYNIVRHTSGDATAFSSAQFARLRSYAEDKNSLRRMGEMTNDRLNKSRWGEEDRVKWDIKEEWLRKGKWDRWELEKPNSEAVTLAEEQEGTWFKLEL